MRFGFGMAITGLILRSREILDALLKRQSFKLGLLFPIYCLNNLHMPQRQELVYQLNIYPTVALPYVGMVF